MDAQTVTTQSEKWQNICAFWLLGLINNSAYVVMIAGATNISQGSIGLVYLAAVTPGMLVKLTGPFWYHLLPYSQRSILIACLMAAAYTTVALNNDSRAWQLLGVVFASLQGGLGEASSLALTAHYVSTQTITAWSSGTGFAGVAGYAWVAILHVLGGLSFRSTLLLANATAIGWLVVYFILLEPPETTRQLARYGSDIAASEDADELSVLINNNTATATTSGGEIEIQPIHTNNTNNNKIQQVPSRHALAKAPKTSSMPPSERVQRALALWPYTVPLLLVYFAEYAMQSGVWTVIGFPNVLNEDSRHRFYVFANWMYQGGVFISRSSGTLWQADRTALWIMPCMQVFFLVFFLLDAVLHFWYSWSLMVICFMTGLLGGAVYVNAFTLISKEVEPQYKEFSLGAASLADSLGIALADVTGIVIQGCLFRANGIDGADFSCGSSS